MIPSRLTAAVCAALACLASGCSLPIVKGGRLHAEPSTAADLPFRSDGFYVSDGMPFPCDRDPADPGEVTPDSTQARAILFTPTGEFVIAQSVRAIRTDSAWVRRGNYRVDSTGVDARTYSDGGDTIYAGYVRRYAITATGPASFTMDRVLDYAPQWIRYNTYTPRGRVCIRQRFTFEDPA